MVLGTVAAAAAALLVMLQAGTSAQPTARAAVAPPARVAPLAPDAPVAPSAALVPDALIAPVGPQTSVAGNETSLEDVISQSIPAIVSIESGHGRGSGFFATPKIVVTNRHVIEGKTSVTVRMSSGNALQGRVEASSQEYDLALIRVEGAAPLQPALRLGTANDVRPGQEVVAIGLALGVFQNSVTRGIISGVRRAERTVVLQTDAAINPGNSGGPLLNRHGIVVGITTMKIAGAAESLGFAVAADHARMLLDGGRVPAEPMALEESAPVSRSLAPAFTGRSSTDHARADGTRRYDEAVTATARRAAQLDTYWDRIKARCGVRAAVGYDREWFGVWDRRVAMTSADASCSAAFGEIETLSADIRATMARAEQDARRSSVLPGSLRDIRRRHRMDWAGFD